jgi:ubiquinone biosynthesis protein Coq4
MDSISYGYSAEPTKNPFKFARALWRLISREANDASTADAAVVELGFVRSRLGRRFARWHVTLDYLKRDPTTAAAIARREVMGPINLKELENLPEGSLGRVFADHCRTRGINPNLVYIPPIDDEGWLLNHLFQTHDIWHVVTGWPNDEQGEVGLGGFYCGQMNSPAFYVFMFTLLMSKVVWQKEDPAPLFDAFVSGYRAGKKARPLFATSWKEMWQDPLEDVQHRFGIPSTVIGAKSHPVAA